MWLCCADDGMELIQQLDIAFCSDVLVFNLVALISVSILTAEDRRIELFKLG